MIKVGYDAGHGGYKDKVKKLYATPGKRTPDGEPEWQFNDTVARAFANELALYNGVASKRFDDSTGKTDISLAARTNGANAWGADYYFSFHHNANTSKWGEWTGVETFIYIGNQPKSRALANAVHPALVKAYGLKDRGIKQSNLHIVRETKMPAVLIEGGFMDSVIDIKKLRDREVLENAGKLIAQAFAKHVGLKKVVADVPKKPVEQQQVPNLAKEEEIVLALLNNTGRKEIRELLKKARRVGIIDAAFHTDEKIEKYDDMQLLSYQAAIVNREFKV